MFYFIFLLPVLKREKGEKGKAEPLKPIFLLILEWMKLKKVIKIPFSIPFSPISPPFLPLRQGKERNLIKR